MKEYNTYVVYIQKTSVVVEALVLPPFLCVAVLIAALALFPQILEAELWFFIFTFGLMGMGAAASLIWYAKAGMKRCTIKFTEYGMDLKLEGSSAFYPAALYIPWANFKRVRFFELSSPYVSVKSEHPTYSFNLCKTVFTVKSKADMDDEVYSRFTVVFSELLLQKNPAALE